MSARARRPRVALIVDHPRRDLAGLVLVALDLCRHGVDCHLVPLNLQARELWALAPDLVVLNYVRRGNDRLARALLQAGITLVLHDTEGGVWSDPGAYAELLWEDRALLHQIRSACMWGPALAEYTVAEGVFRPEQVDVTGCSRFDFYHQRWCGALRAEAAEASRPRVLINTNFYTVNSRFVSTERNVAQMCGEQGLAADRVAAIVAAEEQAIAGFIGLVRQLSRDVPEADFVLRPHPFESLEPYRRGLADCPRVEINGTGSVQSQLFRASALIQRSCTTAIEAGLAGVPALSPQWIPAPSVMPMAEAVSLPCADYPGMLATVRSIVGGGYTVSGSIEQAIRDVAARWFHHIDGEAHRRIGATIRAALPAVRQVDEGQCVRQLYAPGAERGPRPRRERVSSAVRQGLRLSPDWSFARLRAVPPRLLPDKAFDTGDVRGLVSRIGLEVASRGEPVQSVAVTSGDGAGAGAGAWRHARHSVTLVAAS